MGQRGTKKRDRSMNYEPLGLPPRGAPSNLVEPSWPPKNSRTYSPAQGLARARARSSMLPLLPVLLTLLDSFGTGERSPLYDYGGAI